MLIFQEYPLQDLKGPHRFIGNHKVKNPKKGTFFRENRWRNFSCHHGLGKRFKTLPSGSYILP